MSELAIHDGIDREAILRHLNLNPQDVNTQALLLICQRYDLDPVMKHVVLISGRPYVTRDGYLHVAHRSGQLDGIEVLETSENNDEWAAKVAVWRKDMGRPFTYVGRYPKSGQQKKYGPEMAIKTAEVMALRRACDVTGVGAADEQWDEHVEPARDEAPCSLCGELVPGAGSDVEAMRQHRVEVHGWVRTPDGKVAPPPDPSEGAHSLAPSDAPSPAVPSHGEPDAVEPEAQARVAGSAATPASERLQKRLDALPETLRRACEDELHAAGWMPEGMVAVAIAQVPDVSRVIDRYEADANGAAGLAARAASKVKGTAA